MFEREAANVLKLTDDIIAAGGPRLAGSAAAKECALKLAKEAGTFCDRAAIESFSVHPGAFCGFIKVMIVLYLISLPLLPVFPWASVALMSAGLVAFVGENILYDKTLDPFYPRVESFSVVGAVEPRGGVDRQVIISGHHDSARIFNLFVDRPELYSRRLNRGIGTFCFLWAASIAVAAIHARAVGIVAALVFAVGFAFLLPLWRFAAKEGTPGAGDNLASSVAALEMARVLRARRDAGKGLERTRVLFVSFDAEEAGLRGARAYAEAHRGELEALPTFAFNMDCVYRRDKLRLLLTDKNGRVKLDEAATRHVVAIGEGMGLSILAAPIAFLTGGTDAAELAKAGARAVSLMGMDWSNSARSSVYHTPGDTVAAVEPGAVEAAIALGLRFALDVDEGKL
jgi:aminopeptidase YwaD